MSFAINRRHKKVYKCNQVPQNHIRITQSRWLWLIQHCIVSFCIIQGRIPFVIQKPNKCALFEFKLGLQLTGSLILLNCVLAACYAMSKWQWVSSTFNRCRKQLKKHFFPPFDLSLRYFKTYAACNYHFNFLFLFHVISGPE